MAKPRTRWTKQEKEEFMGWHKRLLEERGYPEALKKELTRTCQRWVASVPLVKDEQ